MAVGFVFGVFDTARKRFSSDGSGVAADFGPAAWSVFAIALVDVYRLTIAVPGPS